MAAFSSEKMNMPTKKRSFRHWQLFLNFFIAQLPILALLTIKCLIANYCTRWYCNFKVLSQDEGRADFTKNLRASLFNEGLSNEPSFSRIHLDGQHL
jgi:hypothetical protein